MTWGDPPFWHRFHPARLAYGPAAGREEERKAVDTSLAAGVTLFDTAAMYCYGDSERRVALMMFGNKYFPWNPSDPRVGD